MSQIKEITPKELYQLIEDGKNPYIIDVRNQEEYRELRAAYVKQLLPLGEFEPDLIEARPDEPLYFICRSGRRSFEACAQCEASGMKNLFNIAGGTLEWEANGLPVEKG